MRPRLLDEGGKADLPDVDVVAERLAELHQADPPLLV